MEERSNYEIVREKEATSFNKNPCYEVTQRFEIETSSTPENPRQVKSKHKIPACGWVCTISLVGFILVGSAAFISMGISLWSISSCSQLEMKMMEIQNDFQRKIMELQDNISQQIMEFQNSTSESTSQPIMELQNSANDTTSELERRLTEIHNRNDNITRSLDSKLNEIIQSEQYDSCSHVLQLNPSFPSDHYWIRSSNGSAVRVYCDFNRQCSCDGSSTWTRVAFLNMSDLNQVCPSNWITISSPVRTCGRGRTSSRGCNSVFYSTFGLTYSRVCGRIIAYQDGTPDAFHVLISSEPINGPYVDGVSLTHGSVGSRQHIWTFASALGETYNYDQRYLCPCSNNISWPYSTAFVGNDYFCDSGNHANILKPYSLYSNDPLWDGQGCGPTSTCCQFNNPPWFCKTLPQSTTDDLEVRICHDDPDYPTEDTPIQLLQLYVQ